MKNTKIRTIIGLILSLIFLYLAFRGINWNQAITAIKTARYHYVLPALIVYLLALWVRTYRWTFLLPPGIKISTQKLFPIYIIGCFANNILPLRMGDLYRAYLLSNSVNTSKSQSLASVFVDKVFDALSVLTILGVAIWIFSKKFPDWEQKLFQSASLLLLTGVILLWFVIWNRTFANRMINLLVRLSPRNIRDRLNQILNNFLDGLNTLKNHKLVMMAFLLSITSWLIEAVMYYIIALSLDTHLPIYASPVILAIVNLALMIPASPAGIGTFEFFCIKTSEPFFNPTSIAATYAVFVHLAWFLPITGMGLYFFWFKHLSLKEAQIQMINQKSKS